MIPKYPKSLVEAVEAASSAPPPRQEPPLTRTESVVKPSRASRDLANLRMQIDDMLPRIEALEAEQAGVCAKTAERLYRAGRRVKPDPAALTRDDLADAAALAMQAHPFVVGLDWAEGAKPPDTRALEPMARARKDGTPYMLKFRDDLVRLCPSWGGRREVAEQMAGGWGVARHMGAREGFEPGWFLAGPFGQGLGTDALFEGFLPLPVKVAA